MIFAPGVERKSLHYLYVEGGQDAEHLKFLVQNQMKCYCHHIGKQASKTSLPEPPAYIVGYNLHS